MKRSGFTLVEVLVILAILAALAAILVPTVTNQVRKADMGRVIGDLDNLQTGVEAFLVNVQRYPGAAHQLSTPITSTDTDVRGNTYPAGLVTRWEGPYIDHVFATDGTGTKESGFGGMIQDDFEVVAYGNGVDYLTITILDLAQPEFERLDQEIDGAVDATDGRLRFSAGTTTNTTQYLAVPIN